MIGTQIPPIAAAAFIDMKLEVVFYLLVSVIVVLAVILTLTRRKGWIDFSVRRKWSSRFILFGMSLFIAVPALFIPANGVSDLLFGKIAMESPNLTATAIKLGLYNIYMDHEISSQASPEKRGLVGCVGVLSNQEAQDFQKNCGDNDEACFINIPTMTRAMIITQIREALSNPSSGVAQACKNVDVSKLAEPTSR